MATTWLGFSIAVGLVLVLTPPAWADFQAGLEAADRGDYHTAVKEFQLSAERGDVKARNNLGVMYQLGLGVPQDDQEAVRWYRQNVLQHGMDLKTWFPQEGIGVSRNGDGKEGG